MGSLKKRAYQSLSTRISVRVVAYATGLLLVALSVVLYISRQEAKKGAIEEATMVLDGTLLHIDNTLHQVETGTYNMQWNVEHHLDDPDIMVTYCERLMQANPSMLSCAMAFEPGFYPQKDSLYIVYAYRPNGTEDDSIAIEFKYGRTPYTVQEWYARPKKLDKPCWIEPDANEKTKIDDIITFSLPLHDKTGKFVGILGTDIDTDWLSKTILSAKPYPRSYCALLSKNGKYVIHPDTTRLFHQTVFEQGEKQRDPSVSQVIKRMMNGEEGYMDIEMDGKEFVVFYKPHERAGWSAAVVCPKDELLDDYDRMWFYMLIITGIGLTLVFLLCILTVKHQLHPLQELGATVQDMAEGHFNTPLPESKRCDEIGHLQNSFQKMQQSLAAYIKQADELSASLKERNENLSKTYQQIMKADRIKTDFLHNVTDQIASPMERIKKNADYLRENYRAMSKAEVEKIVNAIRDDSDIITTHLNRLLEVALRSEDPTAIIPNDLIETTA